MARTVDGHPPRGTGCKLTFLAEGDAESLYRHLNLAVCIYADVRGYADPLLWYSSLNTI